MTAAKAFECTSAQEKKPIPKEFFNLLNRNKAFLDALTHTEEHMPTIRSGRSNDSNILTVVKFLMKDTTHIHRGRRRIFYRLYAKPLKWACCQKRLLRTRIKN